MVINHAYFTIFYAFPVYFSLFNYVSTYSNISLYEPWQEITCDHILSQPENIVSVQKFTEVLRSLEAWLNIFYSATMPSNIK